MDPVPQRPAASSSLYVGDLPVDLVNPEDVLYGIFNKVGLVMSIKVCRDINTQRSLGYAYVNFQSASDAERALRELNYSELPGRTGRYIRIMWSSRDPTARKIGNGNIFVKNLDPAIDIRRLRDTFTRFGEILSCKLALDEQGVSRGYGFVHFETEESANQAIAAMNNEPIAGKPISVTRFIKRADREKEAERTFTNIYMKNIRGDASEDDVRAVIGTFCDPSSLVSIFLSPHPQHRTKFALVDFSSHDAAMAVIYGLQNADGGSLVDTEQKFYIGRALRRSDRQVLRTTGANQNLYQSQGRNIYVKHLDDATSKEQLEELFAPFGKITSSALMYDAMGNFRGFAFVCFESKESASAAIREMNGKVVSRRPLYVSQAQQKDRRHQFLEEQRKQLMVAHQQRVSALFGGMMGMWPPGGYRQPGGGYMGPGLNNYVAGRPVNPPPRPTPPNVLQPPPGGRGRLPPMKMPAPIPRAAFTQPPPMRQPMPSGVPSAQLLVGLPPEEQKNALGERLYSKIQSINYSQAAKITGMLLEMDTEEILNVLDDQALLINKVNEAVAVLRQHDASAH